MSVTQGVRKSGVRVGPFPSLPPLAPSRHGGHGDKFCRAAWPGMAMSDTGRFLVLFLTWTCVMKYVAYCTGRLMS